MGVFKALLYVAGGVGAVVLAPMTGGGSLAMAIGAMGTTTAAGVAIGAGVGATAAALHHGLDREDTAAERGRAEGARAAEAIIANMYQEKIVVLVKRFESYVDMEDKLFAMYAVGLAIANADGEICKEELDELNHFVSGCMTGNLPKHIKSEIQKLAEEPPTMAQAIKFAKKAALPKQDIDDILDIVANADGELHKHERAFIRRWEKMSQNYEYA